MGHREAAQPEAADHGPAQPRRRRSGRDRRRRSRAAAARAERRHRRGRVGLRDVRGVRPRVPGRHRARRHDPRPATAPRDGRVALPRKRARCFAASRGRENPWAQPAGARMDWAEGLDVRVLAPGDSPPEVLFWVGCAGAFDERAREATRSTVRLLRGRGRRCRARPARVVHRRPRTTDGPRVPVPDARRAQRLYPERRGRDDDRRELRPLLQHARERVPDYGGTYDVVHHSELLGKLVREGRLHPSRDSVSVTYHDACYLGRHNGRYEAPRDVLGAVSGSIDGDAAEPRALVLLRSRRREVLDGGGR